MSEPSDVLAVSQILSCISTAEQHNCLQHKVSFGKDFPTTCSTTGLTIYPARNKVGDFAASSFAMSLLILFRI